MRRVVVLVFAVCLFCSSAFAASDNFGEGMVQKAKNGAINLFTGILEVPAQIYKGYSNGFEPIKNQGPSKVIGGVLGFFRGLGHAAGRMSWGAMELFGFWTANPADNKGVGIPLDAKYAWQQGKQYSVFKPSLREGIKPIGRKLGHGLANSFLGIAEVPGQIKLGASSGNVVKRAARGVWYWFSREVYGLTDVVSCIVPNPVDNPGVAFNEPWPWSALSAK